MTPYPTCAMCGSTAILWDREVIAGGFGSTTVGLNLTFKHPAPTFFIRTIGVDLKAHVCTACGYTVTFAHDTTTLQQVYRAEQERGR